MSVPAEYELLSEYQSTTSALVTEVRGSLIASSIQVLKEAGHFEAYRARLRTSHRDRVLETAPMGFAALDIAKAHYEACDALELDGTEIGRLGVIVAQRYSDTVFGTLLRTSRRAGIDAPWVALRSLGRIWERMFVGGAMIVQRTGPKDALIEECGNPLSEFRYYKTAHLGWIQSIGDLFVRKLYVRYVRPPRAQQTPFTVAIGASWV